MTQSFTSVSLERIKSERLERANTKDSCAESLSGEQRAGAAVG